MYVDLALPLPIKKLFTYGVPESLVGKVYLGQRVLVQLGKRLMMGVVVGLNVPAPQIKTKNILLALETYPWFSNTVLGLTKWMSEYYSADWGECLKFASPQYPDISGRIWIENVPADLEMKGLSAEEKDTLGLIKSKQKMKLNRLVQSSGMEDIYQHLQHLQQKGLVRFGLRPIKTDPKDPALPLRIRAKSSSTEISGLGLKDDERKIVDLISQDIEKKTYSTFLLMGRDRITRRMVHLELAKKAVQAQKQVLVILPETHLLDETVSSWQRTFNEKMAVLHPQISINQKMGIWEKIKSKEFSLVLGTRSAVFAPLDDLGLIVVEEENHPLHKEEASPHYNARDVAVVRGRLEKATVILSCSFPSLESFYNCQRGKYRLCDIRVESKARPALKTEIIDKKKSGAKAIISPPVLDILRKETKPVVLLLNRRGSSRLVICEDCGLVFRCPDCGISLALHKDESVLRCRYCNYEQKGANVCPQCGGSDFSYRGLGTQDLEQFLSESLPQIKSVRLDKDVTDKPGGAKRILFEFYQGKYQVLLGTQMIFGGLDLSKVGLVIILSIDELLTYPDFRARERTFHFLSQIVDRMIEMNSQAKLVLQTSRPKDWVIRCALRGDFDYFYQKEIEQRKELFYPPFSHLISIWFSGRIQEKAMKFSSSFVQSLNRIIEQGKVSKTKILGPTPIYHAKRKKPNQWQLIIKTTSPMKVNNLTNSILKRDEFAKNRSVRIKVEVDPLSLV
ncbi:MAG TPA: primosomal protein N' [candidate division Zixibacteria bacterium]